MAAVEVQLFFRAPRYRALLMAMLLSCLGVLMVWLTLGEPWAVLYGTRAFDSDYPNAAAAFEIFVRDDWHFPLGSSPDFGGINIFFSDGAPWFALIAKLWHTVSGDVVPFDALILLNFVLFALMAYRIAAHLVKNEAARWLITLLLVFNVIMPVRTLGAQHIALSGYWVVLWAMCCVLGAQKNSRLALIESSVVAVFAFLTHAYLGAMAVGILLLDALFQRQWLRAVLSVLLPLVALYLLGVFGGGHASVGGAKAYSLDLLVFAESLNWGLFPNLYPIYEAPQSDLILYLGSGVWILALEMLLVRLYLYFQNVDNDTSITVLPSPAAAPLRRLLWAGLALVLFAMAFNLRIAGHVLVSIPIVEPFTTLYERFRVAGRFAAPMAYLAIIVITLGWIGLRRRLPAALWFGGGFIAVVLQLGDMYVAGTKAQPEPAVADAAQQRQQVEQLLEDRDWSGRVYKNVGYYELEQQRLIDRLLVEEGARYFSLVHGARLDWDEVEKRAQWIDRAQSGDLTIEKIPNARECIGRNVIVKDFKLCLLE